MKDQAGRWFTDFPAEIMVSDPTGIILEMNSSAEVIFQADGGRRLLGKDVFSCHPEPARTKLAGMMKKQIMNVYFNTEKGEKRLFFQSPWYMDGRFAGFVEISFEVPGDIPHFIRE